MMMYVVNVGARGCASRLPVYATGGTRFCQHSSASSWAANRGNVTSSPGRPITLNTCRQRTLPTGIGRESSHVEIAGERVNWHCWMKFWLPSLGSKEPTRGAEGEYRGKDEIIGGVVCDDLAFESAEGRRALREGLRWSSAAGADEPTGERFEVIEDLVGQGRPEAPPIQMARKASTYSGNGVGLHARPGGQTSRQVGSWRRGYFRFWVQGDLVLTRPRRPGCSSRCAEAGRGGARRLCGLCSARGGFDERVKEGSRRRKVGDGARRAKRPRRCTTVKK